MFLKSKHPSKFCWYVFDKILSIYVPVVLLLNKKWKFEEITNVFLLTILWEMNVLHKLFSKTKSNSIVTAHSPFSYIFWNTLFFILLKENSNKKLIQNLSLYIFLIFLIFMIRNPMIHSKINRLTSKKHMFLKTISLKQQSHLNANLARIFCRNWHIYLYIRNPRRSSAKFMVFFFMLIRKKINK